MRAPKDGFDTRSGVGFGRNASHILSRCKGPLPYGRGEACAGVGTLFY